MASAKPGPDQMPFLDLDKMLGQFKLPGVDLDGIVEAQRKNLEALTQANMRAYEGMQALGQRQAQMLQQAMTQWQATMQELLASDAARSPDKQAELVRRGLEQSLANMRELAEMASRSQTDAWEVIQKRMNDSLADLRRSVGKDAG